MGGSAPPRTQENPQACAGGETQTLPTQEFPQAQARVPGIGEPPNPSSGGLTYYAVPAAGPQRPSGPTPARFGTICAATGFQMAVSNADGGCPGKSLVGAPIKAHNAH